MTSRTMHDPNTRYIAFAAVFALHFVLLQIAQRMSGAAYRVQRVTDDALVWLRLDRPVDVPRKQPVPIERQEAPVERTRSRAPTHMNEETRESPTTPAAASPPRQIDWHANAARSAQLAVESAQEERQRSFGPRKEPPPDELAPPSLFREGPKPKYGDVGEIDGRPVVWMNENCYTELDGIVQTARDAVIANPGSFAAPAINCVGGETGRFRIVQPNPNSFTPWSLNYSQALGKKEADGTLFDHIKKPEEPPEPKAGTEMNELPERVEEPRR